MPLVAVINTHYDYIHIQKLHMICIISFFVTFCSSTHVNTTIVSRYICKALFSFHTLVLIQKFSLIVVQQELPGRHKYWLFRYHIHVIAGLAAGGSSARHHCISVWGKTHTLQERTERTFRVRQMPDGVCQYGFGMTTSGTENTFISGQWHDNCQLLLWA